MLTEDFSLEVKGYAWVILIRMARVQLATQL